MQGSRDRAGKEAALGTYLLLSRWVRYGTLVLSVIPIKRYCSQGSPRPHDRGNLAYGPNFWALGPSYTKFWEPKTDWNHKIHYMVSGHACCLADCRFIQLQVATMHNIQTFGASAGPHRGTICLTPGSTHCNLQGAYTVECYSL